LRLDPQTVRRFADATSVEDLLVNAGRRDSIIDMYRPYLHRRWNEGCTDDAALCQEIRKLGFVGSDPTVRRYLRPFRATITAPTIAAVPAKALHVARWITTNPANLDPENKAQPGATSRRSPGIRAVSGHVRRFATMMRTLVRHRDFPQWIKQVEADDLRGLRPFTTSIQRDLAAVTAGLSLPYSSGPVEGHVNRIKTICECWSRWPGWATGRIRCWCFGLTHKRSGRLACLSLDMSPDAPAPVRSPALA
jgi:transposase